MSAPFDVEKFLIEKTKDLDEVDLTLIKKDISSFSNHVKSAGMTAALSQLALRCGDKSFIDPQWGLLAGRVYMRMVKNAAPATFSLATAKMKSNLSEAYYQFVIDNADRLDMMVHHDRDDTFNLFAVATMIRSYLGHLKIDGKTIICETPQYMYMRVATYLRYPDLDAIEKVYENLSKGNYSQASPTLFNSGMIKPQLSSCFLLDTQDDMREIEKNWVKISTISSGAGAVGVSCSKLRHSEIGTRGQSNGVIPWLTINNRILKAVNQSGLRPGSGTMYLRDCHIDIHEFVELRDEGPEDIRARDLFLGVMVSDLFMKRVEQDQIWSLFCPNKCDHLLEKWGPTFEEHFIKLENEKKYSRQLPARELWLHILRMQIKTGMPFILYIDACNRKSNHQHLGTIMGSNLCTEILEYTSKDEIASCVLGSISLNKCVQEEPSFKNKQGIPLDLIQTASVKYFSFAALEKYVAEMVENLEEVIDRNYYPDHVPEIEYSNKRHRPLGIGVQGFADALALLDITWVNGEGNLSIEAKRLNKQIFECMYFAAMKRSMEMAKIKGIYPSFQGSPLSRGMFQFDLANINIYQNNHFSDIEVRSTDDNENIHSSAEWAKLREDVMHHGARHSLLLALMPTASSANLLDNAECFEPFNALMYARTVLGGQFMIVNKHLVSDLKAIGAWTTESVHSIIENKGSIQHLNLPGGLDEGLIRRLRHLKLKYRTTFEIPQRVHLDLAIDRCPFICQTSSQNCFMNQPSRTKLNAYHFYGWKGGLKTGMYYLRQSAMVDPINMAVNSLIIPSMAKGGSNPGVPPFFPQGTSSLALKSELDVQESNDDSTTPLETRSRPQIDDILESRVLDDTTTSTTNTTTSGTSVYITMMVTQRGIPSRGCSSDETCLVCQT
jgi:ribonucleoside-diphosphate reductase alpha chain